MDVTTNDLLLLIGTKEAELMALRQHIAELNKQIEVLNQAVDLSSKAQHERDQADS